MPNYDYKCMVCDHTFEHFQKMNDDPLVECPDCGGSLKRLIGAGLSPIFKGSGFYQTDYKNKSNGESKKITPSVDTKTTDNSKKKPD